MTATVVTTAVGEVEYAEVGSGPVVLIVHGTPGDWRQAKGLAEDLAGAHRVLLPSRPGYGRTPLSTGRSPREQAEAHVALLDALGVESAAIIGISGGGPSARATAAHHRGRCTHLVLICAVAEHLMTVPAATRLLASVPGLWEAGARVASRRAQRRLTDRDAALQRAVAELGPAERAAVVGDPLAEQDLLAFADARVSAMRAVTGLRNDFRWFHGTAVADPWPPGANLPTLVLHGADDGVVPVAQGRHHADSIPGAVLEVLPDVGHGFALSMRRTTSARIAAFLEEK